MGGKHGILIPTSTSLWNNITMAVDRWNWQLHRGQKLRLQCRSPSCHGTRDHRLQQGARFYEPRCSWDSLERVAERVAMEIYGDIRYIDKVQHGWASPWSGDEYPCSDNLRWRYGKPHILHRQIIYEQSISHGYFGLLAGSGIVMEKNDDDEPRIHHTSMINYM